MLSFGQRLRQERESRNTPLEDISRTTQIGLRYLEALERDEFEALPGPLAFGKLYIRAYARILGFDPQPLIAEYDEERFRRIREARAAGTLAPFEKVDDAPVLRPSAAPGASEEHPPVEGPAAPTGAAPAEVVVNASAEPAREGREEVPSVETTGPAESQADSPAADRIPVDRPSSGRVLRHPAVVSALRRIEAVDPRVRWATVAAFLLLGTVTALAWSGVFSRGHPTPAPLSLSAADMPDAGTDADTTPPVDPDPATIEAPPVEARTSPPQAVPETSSRLRVTEWGVGRGVRNHRPIGQATEFEEGQVVWFTTRVLGGRAGETLRHVWLRDGGWVQTVKLPLGGAHWRTHSRKTLWGTGRWTVEARDAEGNVLARASFACVPRGS